MSREETLTKIVKGLTAAKPAVNIMLALEDGAIKLKKVRPDLEIDFIAEKITNIVKLNLNITLDRIGACDMIRMVSNRLYNMACAAKPLPWELDKND